MACPDFIPVDMLQSIYISRITAGGTADRDGKLQIGDRMVSVSNVYLYGDLE